MGIFKSIYEGIDDRVSLGAVLSNGEVLSDIGNETISYLGEAYVSDKDGNVAQQEYAMKSTTHTYERQDRDNNQKLPLKSGEGYIQHATRQEVFDTMLAGCKEIWESKGNYSKVLDGDIDRDNKVTMDTCPDEPTAQGKSQDEVSTDKNLNKLKKQLKNIDNKISAIRSKYLSQLQQDKKEIEFQQEMLDGWYATPPQKTAHWSQEKEDAYKENIDRVEYAEMEYEEGTLGDEDEELQKYLETRNTFVKGIEKLGGNVESGDSYSRALRCGDMFMIKNSQNLHIVIEYQDKYHGKYGQAIGNAKEFVAITLIRTPNWGGTMKNINKLIEVDTTAKSSYIWWDLQSQSEIDEMGGDAGEFRNIARNKLQSVVLDTRAYKRERNYKEKDSGSGVM